MAGNVISMADGLVGLRLGDAASLLAETGELLVSALCEAEDGTGYAGTLPHAQVYRRDRDHGWSALRTLDTTPAVLYRRAHAMGVYRGELFCGTLPGANVYSMQAGLAVSHDRALGVGWRHVVTVESEGRSPCTTTTVELPRGPMTLSCADRLAGPTLGGWRPATGSRRRAGAGPAL
jgi:hypothetical protein